jgi:GrpB-like predicted nucleotidyltransferase (UPF0157 family)
VADGLAVIVPYDERWPRLFETEQIALAELLSPWLDGGIHHVGSTAVPGLAAKPIIDMIAGVRDLEEARAAFEPLGQLGYVHHEHRPEAHAFAKPGGGGWWKDTHHLHLTVPGSDIWRERLAFRDALRATPELRADYEQWKVSHASRVGQSAPYRLSKTAFVSRVLEQAGVGLAPDRDRLTHAGPKEPQG